MYDDGGTDSRVINFSTAFDTVPTVTAIVARAYSPNNSEYDLSDKITLTKSDITKSSFTVKLANNSTTHDATVVVQWSAQA